MTNFLVDLSGQYANCNNLHQKGKLTADRTTPEGASITVLVDSAVGNASDITAVHGYITGVIDRWTAGGQHSGLVRLTSPTPLSEFFIDHVLFCNYMY